MHDMEKHPVQVLTWYCHNCERDTVQELRVCCDGMDIEYECRTCGKVYG